MRIDICIILVTSFIKKQKNLLLIGNSAEIFSEIYSAAQDEGNEEIIACLDRITDLDMVDNCFPSN